MNTAPTPLREILLHTWRLIVPISMSRLIMLITGFIGTLIIARLSSEILAASSLISSIQAFFFFCGVSLLFSVSAMVSHAFGGKRHEEVGGIFQQALLFGVLLSIPIMIIEWNIGAILIALGQAPRIAVIVQEYFRWYLWAVPAVAMIICCQQVLLAVNKRQFVFYMSIFALIVAVGLAWILVDYFHVGVAGLAIAYVIQSWLALVVYFYYFHAEKSFAAYQLFIWRFKNTFHLLKQLIQIGWPIMVQNTVDLFTFVTASIMAGWLGAEALGAQQIVNQYFILLCVPVLAIAQASTILVGQSRGANKIADINRYAYASLGFSLFFSLIVLLVFLIFPYTLIHLYTGTHQGVNNHLEQLAHIVLILTALRLVFDAIFEVKMGSLRGLYDTKFAMVVTILAVIIGIPLAYILGFTFAFGLVGMVIASIITTVACALAFWWRWHVRVKALAV